MSTPEDKAREIDQTLKSKAADDDKMDRLLSALDSLHSRLDDYGKKFNDVCSRMDALENSGYKGQKPEDDLNAEGKEMREGDWEDRGSAKRIAADAALRNRDAEADELAAAQSRADHAAGAWGKRAPKPIWGETSRMYRGRCLREFQKYSREYKDVDLRAIGDKNLFTAIESRIYADALKAAMTVEPGQALREIKQPDGHGRIVSTFVGDPHTWLNPHGRTRQLARFMPNKG